jgi:hypothetical protein
MEDFEDEFISDEEETTEMVSENKTVETPISPISTATTLAAQELKQDVQKENKKKPKVEQKQLNIRLSKQEYEILLEAASKKNLSPGEFLKSLVKKTATGPEVVSYGRSRTGLSTEEKKPWREDRSYSKIALQLDYITKSLNEVLNAQRNTISEPIKSRYLKTDSRYSDLDIEEEKKGTFSRVPGNTELGTTDKNIQFAKNASAILRETIIDLDGTEEETGKAAQLYAEFRGNYPKTVDPELSMVFLALRALALVATLKNKGIVKDPLCNIPT